MDDDLTFRDLKEEIRRQFVRDGWLTVYSISRDQSKAVFCALAPNADVSKAMKSEEWNLHIGDGRPGFVFSYRGGVKKNYLLQVWR